MSDAEFPTDKIPDPALRRLAAERSSESVSVLVGLSLPPRRAGLGPGGRDGRPVVRAAPDTPASRAEVAVRVEETAAFLERLLGRAPVWLDASRVFVVVVDGEQLRAVAGFEWVKAIHPNARVRPLGAAP